ncbi:U3 small nucleolar ribonucleoprotein complex, subunit Mpp10 [Crassisporium funariophilum]|nr:U3 small nucleolar ribonucleoprotein complex, subunit Mpp10 [Crassisporium funariophilum]
MDVNQDNSLPVELRTLSILLEESPEGLATGSQDLHAAALNAARYVFDVSLQSEASSRSHVIELLSSLAPTQAPQTRSKANAAPAPTTQLPDKELFEFTPLKSLFVDGMDEEQIWAQLDLRTKTICQVLDFVLEGESEDNDKATDENDNDDEEENLRKALADLEEDENVDMSELMEKYGMGESDGSDNSEDEGPSFENSDGLSESDQGEEGGVEGFSSLRDPSSDDESESGPSAMHLPNFVHHTSPRKKNRASASELDDGFFNLAEFNADTERAEARSSSKGRLADDDESDEDMDVDLFTSVDPLDNFDENDLENDPDEPFYRDFFEPPRSSSNANKNTKIKTKTKPQSNTVRFHEQVRVREIKATGKNKSLHDDDDDDDESENDEDLDHGDEHPDFDSEWNEAISEDEDSSDSESEVAGNQPINTETIERIKHDLFAEAEEEVQDDLTTHERRLASLREQIAELESANVAKKDWVLMGEAGSRQRPQNSLLEEDLEFDRVMKAVPVITEDAVHSLEETIKARILEGRFDDVLRLRPLEDKPFLPSKFFELQDSKSTQSLAQIYESDYIASQSGGATSDDLDGKLKKEHDEVTLLWEKICGKLDALCNAHFVPKQPKATISTVSNASTATLESALPTTKSTATMLAPEEVFSSSSSSLRARSELSPAEKRSLRTKDRKTKKRQRDALDKSVDKFAKAKSIGGVKRQKQAALESVVKHGKGVTVVGKKGVVHPRSKDKRKV